MSLNRKAIMWNSYYALFWNNHNHHSRSR